MNYFKDKATKSVFAYDDEQLEQVSRLTELELLILDNEPAFTEAKNKLQQALSALYESREKLGVAIANEVSEEEIKGLQENLNLNEKTVTNVSNSFNDAESNYQPFKDEYDAISPVFFGIRENLKVTEKMTPKEIEKHLNPPISKEQYIAEAEIQKQLFLDEAERHIVILERKVRLGMATDDEKDLLTAWEIYSVKVVDVDTSLAPNIFWPQIPEY